MVYKERRKFVFLVFKQFLFDINESCSQPFAHSCGRRLSDKLMHVEEQNGFSLRSWVKKLQSTQGSRYQSAMAVLCIICHTGLRDRIIES